MQIKNSEILFPNSAKPFKTKRITAENVAFSDGYGNYNITTYEGYTAINANLVNWSGTIEVTNVVLAGSRSNVYMITKSTSGTLASVTFDILYIKNEMLEVL